MKNFPSAASNRFNQPYSESDLQVQRQFLKVLKTEDKDPFVWANQL